MIGGGAVWSGAGWRVLDVSGTGTAGGLRRVRTGLVAAADRII